MIAKRDPSHLDYQLYLINGTEYLVLTTGNGNLISTTVPPLNTWVLVTATINSGVATLYMNGAQVATGPLSASLPTIAPLYFGTQYGTGAGVFGLIDDVRIYNRALSAAEIAAMYVGGK
jgi:hypothetical protein